MSLPDVSTADLEERKDNIDDKAFAGATLEISGTTTGMESEVEFRGMAEASLPKSESTPAGLSRDRPGSAFGRSSTVSVGSKTSASARRKTTDHSKDLFFSKKTGSFETAVEACARKVLKADIDGDLQGAWLLTEIDHWDHEREKVVMLTDKSCIIIQYDFVTSKLKDFKRIGLHMINTVQLGDFVYPAKSLMTKIHPRDHGGIRFYWGDVTNISFGQRWNPFASDLPTATFSHHPLIYNAGERETVTYNVDDFYESLVQAVRRSLKAMSPEQDLVIKEEPINIESYLSITSLVFNQSLLGFNRDRNGVSF